MLKLNQFQFVMITLLSLYRSLTFLFGIAFAGDFDNNLGRGVEAVAEHDVVAVARMRYRTNLAVHSPAQIP